MSLQIHAADSEPDIRRCVPVLLELRPHLTPDTCLAQVLRQRAGGYHLAFAADGDDVRGVAGYRIMETLFAGRMLYVDDLVTTSTGRSRGVGKALLQWLIARAELEGCAEFHLDSGVHRFDAHRFYFTHRMHISSYHFKRTLR